MQTNLPANWPSLAARGAFTIIYEEKERTGREPWTARPPPLSHHHLEKKNQHYTMETEKQWSVAKDTPRRRWQRFAERGIQAHLGRNTMSRLTHDRSACLPTLGPSRGVRLPSGLWCQAPSSAVRIWPFSTRQQLRDSCSSEFRSYQIGPQIQPIRTVRAMIGAPMWW